MVSSFLCTATLLLFRLTSCCGIQSQQMHIFFLSIKYETKATFFLYGMQMIQKPRKYQVFSEKEIIRIHTVCMHRPDAIPYQPYLQLSPHLNLHKYGTAKTVWPVLMNSDHTVTLHLGRLTTELSVGNAQSGTLGLKTTVSLQQQHLQRFGGFLTEGIKITLSWLQMFDLIALIMFLINDLITNTATLSALIHY